MTHFLRHRWRLAVLALTLAVSAMTLSPASAFDPPPTTPDVEKGTFTQLVGGGGTPYETGASENVDFVWGETFMSNLQQGSLRSEANTVADNQLKQLASAQVDKAIIYVQAASTPDVDSRNFASNIELDMADRTYIYASGVAADTPKAGFLNILFADGVWRLLEYTDITNSTKYILKDAYDFSANPVNDKDHATLPGWMVVQYENDLDHLQIKSTVNGLMDGFKDLAAKIDGYTIPTGYEGQGTKLCAHIECVITPLPEANGEWTDYTSVGYEAWEFWLSYDNIQDAMRAGGLSDSEVNWGWAPAVGIGAAKGLGNPGNNSLSMMTYGNPEGRHGLSATPTIVDYVVPSIFQDSRNPLDWPTCQTGGHEECVDAPSPTTSDLYLPTAWPAQVLKIAQALGEYRPSTTTLPTGEGYPVVIGQTGANPTLAFISGQMNQATWAQDLVTIRNGTNADDYALIVGMIWFDSLGGPEASSPGVIDTIDEDGIPDGFESEGGTKDHRFVGTQTGCDGQGGGGNNGNIVFDEDGVYDTGTVLTKCHIGDNYYWDLDKGTVTYDPDDF